MIIPINTSTQKRTKSWIYNTIILTNVICIAAVAIAYTRFGSIRTALSYLSGERLIADAASRTFRSRPGDDSGTVVFRLANFGDRPITVLGARVSCTCAVAEDLPMIVLPGATCPLKISIDTKTKSGRVSEKITLYTNDGLHPGLVRLAVVGTVLRKSVDQPKSHPR